MVRFKLLLALLYFLSGHLIKAQLEGGLLGILKPEGVQLSLPGLLGLTGKKTSTVAPTTTTTTTTTTTPAPLPTSAPVTPKPNKKPTDPTTCGFTPTFVNGKRSCRGKLIFQENFAKLVETKWITENRFAGEPDFEFTIYQGNAENLYVNKNRLHIRPTLTEDKYGVGFVTGEQELNFGDTCTGRPGTEDCVQTPRAWQIIAPTISSLISTKGRFSFVYGIVEIKARLPKGDWIYPQLYLKPKSEYYGPGYGSGLIKIAYTNGNVESSKNLTGGVVLSQSNSGSSYGIKNVASPTHWNRDFHVYRIEWTADSITLKVDDEIYGVVEAPEGGFGSVADLEHEPEVLEKWKKGTKLAPFDKEMYLVLGVGVGGQSFPNYEGGTKPWENFDPKGPLQFYRAQNVWKKTWGDNSDLVIDYVKIWAL